MSKKVKNIYSIYKLSKSKFLLFIMREHPLCLQHVVNVLPELAKRASKKREENMRDAVLLCLLPQTTGIVSDDPTMPPTQT